jgi:hypothetical protein
MFGPDSGRWCGVLANGKELVRGCHGKPQNILAGVPVGLKSGTAANIPR